METWKYDQPFELEQKFRVSGDQVRHHAEYIILQLEAFYYLSRKLAVSCKLIAGTKHTWCWKDKATEEERRTVHRVFENMPKATLSILPFGFF